MRALTNQIADIFSPNDKCSFMYGFVIVCAFAVC